MTYYLYIIETEDNTLYCGIAKNLIQRYKKHSDKKGAKYTISHPPKRIAYAEIFEDKSTALKEEYRIKKTFSREQKLKLIEENKVRTKEILDLLKN